MSTVDAIFSGGVFRPLGEVSIAENQRVRLTIESSSDTVGPARVHTAQDLLDSNVIGIWADRQDIGDCRDFAGQLREAAQTPRGLGHAAG